MQYFLDGIGYLCLFLSSLAPALQFPVLHLSTYNATRSTVYEPRTFTEALNSAVAMTDDHGGRWAHSFLGCTSEKYEADTKHALHILARSLGMITQQHGGVPLPLLGIVHPKDWLVDLCTTHLEEARYGTHDEIHDAENSQARSNREIMRLRAFTSFIEESGKLLA